MITNDAATSPAERPTGGCGSRASSSSVGTSIPCLITKETPMSADQFLTLEGRPTVRVERTYPHPIEKVWRAVTTPEHLGQCGSSLRPTTTTRSGCSLAASGRAGSSSPMMAHSVSHRSSRRSRTPAAAGTDAAHAASRCTAGAQDGRPVHSAVRVCGSSAKGDSASAARTSDSSSHACFQAVSVRCDHVGRHSPAAPIHAQPSTP